MKENYSINHLQFHKPYKYKGTEKKLTYTSLNYFQLEVVKPLIEQMIVINTLQNSLVATITQPPNSHVATITVSKNGHFERCDNDRCENKNCNIVSST